MNKNKISVETNLSGRAFYEARVICAETNKVISETGPKKNLLTISPHLYALGKQIQKCYAGTGSTPNKADLDGTYQQTGTTVTRASGSGVFSSDNVNDFIKFAGGERARIVTLTNSLTVEVDRSQTVAASSATIYNTSRTTLDTEIKNTTVESGDTGGNYDSETGTATLWNTFDFTTETVARTYQEIGFSSNEVSVLFGRLVLDSPVSVDVGQFLQVKVTLIWALGNFRVNTPIEVDVTGWPRPYNIQSIEANGTSFDLTFDEDHHYLTGGKINIDSALPEQKAISTITSTSSVFTVNTSAAHGFLVGESIEIEDSALSGYDGVWTIASVPSSTSLTVTSAINLGTAAGGTVRHETPVDWFNGEWTIASVPTTDSVRITSAITPPDAGAAGTAFNNLKASAIISNYGFNYLPAAQSGGGIALPFARETYQMRIVDAARMKTGMAHGVFTSYPNALHIAGSESGTNAAYNPATLKRSDSYIIESGEAVSKTIRQLVFVADFGALWVTFEEPQRKDDGYILTFQNSSSWEPELD